jgi:hypothetical protein
VASERAPRHECASGEGGASHRQSSHQHRSRLQPSPLPPRHGEKGPLGVRSSHRRSTLPPPARADQTRPLPSVSVAPLCSQCPLRPSFLPLLGRVCGRPGKGEPWSGGLTVRTTPCCFLSVSQVRLLRLWLPAFSFVAITPSSPTAISSVLAVLTFCALAVLDEMPKYEYVC